MEGVDLASRHVHRRRLMNGVMDDHSAKMKALLAPLDEAASVPSTEAIRGAASGLRESPQSRRAAQADQGGSDDPLPVGPASWTTRLRRLFSIAPSRANSTSLSTCWTSVAGAWAR